MIIAHNMLAMDAQRQYKINTDAKKKSTEKLSSGYKINRAADDAAGLTISEKMRSLIRGLNQGTDNTQDGISWIHVADGAMEEIHDMLHRLKELAVKSANGTNTYADRKAIDKEAQQLLDQIDQIDYYTQFNTKDVFIKGDVILSVDGSPGDLELYEGTDDNGVVTYGGFLFHGKRIPFSEFQKDGDKIVEMVDGQQYFKKGAYSYKDPDTGYFFNIGINEDTTTPFGMKRDLTITAKGDGIYVDGYRIDWSDVKDDDGNCVSPSNLHKGDYSFNYGGAKVTLTVGEGSVVRNMDYFIASINTMTSTSENGGVSYQWVTYVDDVLSEKAANIVNASFAETGSNQRTITNKMAYDAGNDTYDKDDLTANSGKIEYTVKTAYTSYDSENTRDTYGTDDSVNAEIYLVSSNSPLANKTGVAPKEQDVNNETYYAEEKADTYAIQDPTDAAVNTIDKVSAPNYSAGEAITNWSKGVEITAGDPIETGELLTLDMPEDPADPDYGKYISAPRYSDATYTYLDDSELTDIRFDYVLSDVTSADSMMQGLDGTLLTTDYSGKYSSSMRYNDTDYIEQVNCEDSQLSVTYDIETALGRDFDLESDIIAELYGDQEGTEGGSANNAMYDGKIVFDSNRHEIVFGIKGNINESYDPNYPDIDSLYKSSETVTAGREAERKTNNIDIYVFKGDTRAAETQLTNSIMYSYAQVMMEKIDYILSGQTETVSGKADSQNAARVEGNTDVKIEYSVTTYYNAEKSTKNTQDAGAYTYTCTYDDLLETFRTSKEPDSINHSHVADNMYVDVKMRECGSFGVNGNDLVSDVDTYIHLNGNAVDFYKGLDKTMPYKEGNYMSTRQFFSDIYKAAGANNLDFANALGTKLQENNGDIIRKEDLKDALIDALNDLYASPADRPGLEKSIIECTKAYIESAEFGLDTLNYSNGRITFTSDEAKNSAENNVLSKLVNKYTDDNSFFELIGSIKSSDGTDQTDPLVLTQSYISRYYYSKYDDSSFDFNNPDDILASSVNGLDKAILEYAREYALNAMDEIATNSKYTMQAAGSSTVSNLTVHQNGYGTNRVYYESDVEIQAAKKLRIQHSGVDDDYTYISQFSISTAALKIASLRLSTAHGARKALSKLDYALAYTSSKRSELGATQNRLEHTLRNNENKSENTTAAESRIRDTDMAKEMVNFTKQNIISQVSEAMIAQANQSKQGVMTILGS